MGSHSLSPTSSVGGLLFLPKPRHVCRMDMRLWQGPLCYTQTNRGVWMMPSSRLLSPQDRPQYGWATIGIVLCCQHSSSSSETHSLHGIYFSSSWLVQKPRTYFWIQKYTWNRKIRQKNGCLYGVTFLNLTNRHQQIHEKDVNNFFFATLSTESQGFTDSCFSNLSTALRKLKRNYSEPFFFFEKNVIVKFSTEKKCEPF